MEMSRASLYRFLLIGSSCFTLLCCNANDEQHNLEFGIRENIASVLQDATDVDYREIADRIECKLEDEIDSLAASWVYAKEYGLETTQIKDSDYLYFLISAACRSPLAAREFLVSLAEGDFAKAEGRIPISFSLDKILREVDLYALYPEIIEENWIDGEPALLIFRNLCRSFSVPPSIKSDLYLRFMETETMQAKTFKPDYDPARLRGTEFKTPKLGLLLQNHFADEADTDGDGCPDNLDKYPLIPGYREPPGTAELLCARSIALKLYQERFWADPSIPVFVLIGSAEPIDFIIPAPKNVRVLCLNEEDLPVFSTLSPFWPIFLNGFDEWDLLSKNTVSEKVGGEEVVLFDGDRKFARVGVGIVHGDHGITSTFEYFRGKEDWYLHEIFGTYGPVMSISGSSTVSLFKLDKE